MQQKIYLDNGSTSFPKAPGVGQAMCSYIENVGVNISRGGYESAYSAAQVVMETREMLCQLFQGPDAKNVIFTNNVTASLNVLLKGYLKAGDHVLTSSMEHNAVMRPLVQLQKQGVSFDRIPCDEQTGELRLDQLEGMIRPNTRAVVMTHASNVCGTLMPIQQVGEICQKHGLMFFVDAAQTAGVFPIHMKDMHIDALAFTGHKSLLGPQGIGGFVLTDALAQQVNPLLSGGTGSMSDSEEVPSFLPDRFEPGTMNLPGIFGLHASLSWLMQDGKMQEIHGHEMALCQTLLEGFHAIQGVRVVGTDDLAKRGPVVSIDCLDQDNGEIAFLLEEQFGVMTRCGLHCAPSAHKTLGTFPQGTIRFVPGHATTLQEVQEAVQGVRKLVEK